MNPDLLDELMELREVKGFALVSSEDGSILKTGGITPGNIDDLVAFIGSAAEIIAETCETGGIDSIKGIGRENIVILPFNGNYLGIILEEDVKDENIEDKVSQKLVSLKKEAVSDIERVFVERARQLNMLIKEFVKESDPKMWREYIESGLEALSKEGKLKDSIKLEGMELKVVRADGLSREDINKFMKLLLDYIVKKALSSFGKDQTKMIVQKVIMEISKKAKE
ncbi:MAG: hypothetical protein ABIN61_06375 [candidate division WOR-3 bacterium]